MIGNNTDSNTDCHNEIINRTIKALEDSRCQHADGTPIPGWQGCEGARAVEFASDALNAMIDGLSQMIIAIADLGPGMSPCIKADVSPSFRDVVDELLFDTIHFNDDVDPADTRADWEYDCCDQWGAQ